jgi:outer membrane protein OmpA-like peptidoglycan-associated protein
MVEGRRAMGRLAKGGGVALTLALLAAGCTGAREGAPGSRTAAGGLIGALAGGLTGAAVEGGAKGAVIGAAAGAALGSGVGYYLDRQQAMLERALKRERDARQAEVERVAGDRLKATIDDEVAFDYESTAIRPDFLPTLERVADVLAEHGDTRVLVVGHTDSVGPDAYNRELSLARAEAVRDALATYGVDPARVRAEGRGESESRIANDSEAGREANRRVEILVTPVA